MSQGADGRSGSSSPVGISKTSSDPDTSSTRLADDPTTNNYDDPSNDSGGIGGGGSSSADKLGRLQFSLGYDTREMILTLKVIRATDLAAKDFSGTSDPYVKIMLLPDKKHKLTTNIKRKNLNPRWNETFIFEGKSSPPKRLLHLALTVNLLKFNG